MSAADAQRFIDDVAKDKALAERVKPHAAGLAALAAGAKTLGYDFTVDELKQAMRGKAKQNLNDAQLDAIAGGAAPPSTNDVALQSAVVVNTIGIVINTFTSSGTMAQGVGGAATVVV
jgi:predicted ribosomally synthesized peptide with nif11-like leader